MQRGFIRVWRELDEKPLWDDRPFAEGQAWIDLLMLACWKPRTAKVRGIKISLKPGQLIASRKYLANRWGWGSRGKVERFMADLETDSRIVQHKNNVCTVVTITNWSIYQGDNTTKRTAERAADGQQTDTPKKGKKGKKEIQLPFSSSDFLEAWAGYLEVRRKNRQPNTDRALGMLITKMDGKTEGRCIKELDTATERGWKSIFYDDDKPKKNDGIVDL